MIVNLLFKLNLSKSANIYSEYIAYTDMYEFYHVIGIDSSYNDIEGLYKFSVLISKIKSVEDLKKMLLGKINKIDTFSSNISTLCTYQLSMNQNSIIKKDATSNYKNNCKLSEFILVEKEKVENDKFKNLLLKFDQEKANNDQEDRFKIYKILNNIPMHTNFTFGYPTEWYVENKVNKSRLVNAKTNDEKPDKCKLCKQAYPKSDKYEERHDPCIKDLPNAFHACCGHGVNRPYVAFAKHASDGECLEYEEALEYFKKHGKGPFKKD